MAGHSGHGMRALATNTTSNATTTTNTTTSNSTAAASVNYEGFATYFSGPGVLNATGQVVPTGTFNLYGSKLAVGDKAAVTSWASASKVATIAGSVW